MLFSLSWINKYIDISDKTPEDVYKALNSLGLEVEEYNPLCWGTNLVSAKVLKVEKHPDADKLNVCQVDNGVETVQIVCGAPNVAAEQMVILAQPGATLPGNLKIKKSQIRGQESNGMICSLKEIGYPEEFLSEEENTGIHAIKKEIAIGDKNVLKTLGYEDTIFEISLTPNRGDCLSVYQIAKELSVYFDKPLKTLGVKEINFIQNSKLIETDLVDVISLTTIENLVNKQTPDEFKTPIQLVGVNSKSLLVDISNFVMLETGQPLHFYDKDKIKGQIKVVSGLTGTMIGLDDEEYKYEANDILIKDDEKVVSIAGIIGSKDSAVDKKTKSIIVEAAVFNRTAIRKTTIRLNKFTNAATRFTKGRDANQIKVALSRVLEVLEVSGEKPKVSNTIYCGELNIERIGIDFDFNKVKQYLGFDIPKAECLNILNKLDIIIKDGKAFPPTIRIDIQHDVDVIEEIARVNGYDEIPNIFSKTKPSLRNNCLMYDYNKKIKNLLTNLTSQEVITYSLTSKDKFKDFGLNDYKEVKLAKPLSEEREYMRHSTIPSLIEVAKYNNDNGIKNINIYEISEVYGDQNHWELAMLQKGQIGQDPLYGINTEASFGTIKGYVETLLSTLGFEIPRISLKNMEEKKFFNHFNAADIFLGKTLIGRFGEIHPIYLKNLKTKNIFAAQINLSQLIDQKVSKLKVKEISNLPSVEQDYTFDVAKEISVLDIKKIIKTSSKLITNIEITSIYTGESVPEGKKAITAKVTYNNPEITITDKDKKEFRNSLISSAEKINATFRG